MVFRRKKRMTVKRTGGTSTPGINPGNNDYTTIYDEIDSGDVGTLQATIDDIRRRNGTLNLNEVISDNTPLVWAIGRKNVIPNIIDILRVLIVNGANPNTLVNGSPPLWHIFANHIPNNDPNDPNNDLAIARFLLDNGAKPDTKDFMGLTPLMSAATSGNLELVELLLDKGAIRNITTNDDPPKTALDFANDRLARNNARNNPRNNDRNNAIIRLIQNYNPKTGGKIRSRRRKIKNSSKKRKTRKIKKYNSSI